MQRVLVHNREMSTIWHLIHSRCTFRRGGTTNMIKVCIIRSPDEMHEIRQKSIGNPEITVEIEEIISFLWKSARNQEIWLKSILEIRWFRNRTKYRVVADPLVPRYVCSASDTSSTCSSSRTRTNWYGKDRQRWLRANSKRISPTFEAQDLD